MKKIIIIISIIVVILAAVSVFAVIGYTKSDDYTGDTLPDSIKINGVDCSGLDISAAADKLTDAWNHRTIVIKGTLNEKLASFTDF